MKLFLIANHMLTEAEIAEAKQDAAKKDEFLGKHRMGEFNDLMIQVREFLTESSNQHELTRFAELVRIYGAAWTKESRETLDNHYENS